MWFLNSRAKKPVRRSALVIYSTSQQPPSEGGTNPIDDATLSSGNPEGFACRSDGNFVSRHPLHQK